MQYRKTVTIMLAALVAACLLVAGNASANTLCQEDVTTCAESSQWPATSEVDFTMKAGTSSILKDTANLQTETCTESTVRGTVTDNGAGGGIPTASVGIDGLSFASCTHTGAHALTSTQAASRAWKGKEAAQQARWPPKASWSQSGTQRSA